MAQETLFDKIWNRHVIKDLGDGYALLHVSRNIMHDGGGGPMRLIRERGYAVRSPELNLGTLDHAVTTEPGRTKAMKTQFSARLDIMREESEKAGIALYDVGEPGQGIVHVVGPELGYTLPGTLLTCGDSHTCTHGGMGAAAFGIGASEVAHVLATQTIVQRRPQTLRATFEGARPAGVQPKDMILYLIGKIGTAGGTGYAVEYAGGAVRDLDIEGRLTMCNLSIELGAKIGMVAPDETTFAYLKDRPLAPKGDLWERAVADWRTLPTDPDAVFDREVAIDMAEIAPQITWGTSPENVIAVDQTIPDPATLDDPDKRSAWEASLDYMDLKAGQPIAGTPVDWVFIGSCTNSRLSDLRAAAAIAKGRKVADRVTAWVVPGSETVKRQAEAEGLDAIFKAAGFQWREPGCSMCLAFNGDRVPPGKRSVSTTNRNFVGRQGPGARTHLASPPMAAAAAIAGCIADVRAL